MDLVLVVTRCGTGDIKTSRRCSRATLYSRYYASSQLGVRAIEDHIQHFFIVSVFKHGRALPHREGDLVRNGRCTGVDSIYNWTKFDGNTVGHGCTHSD